MNCTHPIILSRQGLMPVCYCCGERVNLSEIKQKERKK